MKHAFAILLVACGSKAEPPPAEDLTCPAVVLHVAKLTRRAIDYARPKDNSAYAETDPRYMRQLRVDQAIDKACGKRPVEDYGPCAREVVLAAMAAECVEREWSDDRKRCLLAAADGKAIEACGPAPAPTLTAPVASTAALPLGAACTGDAQCSAIAKCVGWTTEGGERRATCEIPCGPAPAYECPPGRDCFHQGGGPSEVCLEAR